MDGNLVIKLLSLTRKRKLDTSMKSMIQLIFELSKIYFEKFTNDLHLYHKSQTI